MPVLVIVLLTILLIAVNALYVAAEFSTVSARRSRLSQLSGEGNRLAQAVLPIVENPVLLDRYIATCQLGITISSLLLGFFSQSSVADLVRPWVQQLGGLSEAAAQSISATILLLFFTVLQVIFGELVPKNIGVQYPEQMAMATVGPTSGSMALFRPLIWLFNGSGQFLMSLLGLSTDMEHVHVHAPEEIILLVEESEAGGLLNKEERRLLENTLQLRELMVRQVMIPRTRILAAHVEQPCDEAFKLLAESSYSRLLLYEDSLDDVVGVVHLKDLLCLRMLTGQTDMRAAMRPVLYVPETMAVAQVMAQLQRDQYYVAVVLDEYGGTAGMVTLKDLVEEIFGEFQDEFDTQRSPFRLLPGGRLQLRGDTLLRDLNEWLDLLLPSSDVDTIGGLVLTARGQVPEVGDEVQVEGLTLRVDAMSGKGIAAVSLAVTPEQVERLMDVQV